MSHSVHVRKPESPRTSSERIMYVKRERNAFQIHLQYPVCTLHLPALALNTASYTENITTKQSKKTFLIHRNTKVRLRIKTLIVNHIIHANAQTVMD